MVQVGGIKTGSTSNTDVSEDTDADAALWGNVSTESFVPDEGQKNPRFSFFQNSGFAQKFKNLIMAKDPVSAESDVPINATESRLHKIINGDYKQAFANFMQRFKTHTAPAAPAKNE